MEYKKLIIENFLDKLSSTKSMPGGGVATALVGANAISCALKVCNLSLGKEKYKDYEVLIKESIDTLKENRKKFLDYMDEDAEHFKIMEEVYKLSKDTPLEKEKRKEALADACLVCSDTPMKIIENAISSLGIVSLLVGKTNVSAASDLKIAELLLKATVHCGWDNVEINAKYIMDANYQNKIAEVKKQVESIKI